MNPHGLILAGGVLALLGFFVPLPGGLNVNGLFLVVGIPALLVGFLWLRANKTKADTMFDTWAGPRTESIDDYRRRIQEREERRQRGELDGTYPAMLFVFDPRYTRWPGRLIDVPFDENGHPDPNALLPFVRDVLPSVRAVRTEEKGAPELRVVDVDTGATIGEISSNEERWDRIRRREFATDAQAGETT